MPTSHHKPKPPTSASIPLITILSTTKTTTKMTTPATQTHPSVIAPPTHSQKDLSAAFTAVSNFTPKSLEVSLTASSSSSSSSAKSPFSTAFEYPPPPPPSPVQMSSGRPHAF
ncbi:hypothetical protein BDW69DRAFT_180041 [Aspergillus filifer]